MKGDAEFLARRSLVAEKRRHEFVDNNVEEEEANQKCEEDDHQQPPTPVPSASRPSRCHRRGRMSCLLPLRITSTTDYPFSSGKLNLKRVMFLLAKTTGYPGTQGPRDPRELIKRKKFPYKRMKNFLRLCNYKQRTYCRFIVNI